MAKWSNIISPKNHLLSLLHTSGPIHHADKRLLDSVIKTPSTVITTMIRVMNLLQPWQPTPRLLGWNLSSIWKEHDSLPKQGELPPKKWVRHCCGIFFHVALGLQHQDSNSNKNQKNKTKGLLTRRAKGLKDWREKTKNEKKKTEDLRWFHPLCYPFAYQGSVSQPHLSNFLTNCWEEQGAICDAAASRLSRLETIKWQYQSYTWSLTHSKSNEPGYCWPLSFLQVLVSVFEFLTRGERLYINITKWWNHTMWSPAKALISLVSRPQRRA